MSLQSLPNLLTALRIGFAAAVFVLLCVSAGAMPGQSEPPDFETQSSLLVIAFVLWVVGALTDYFDGALARKLGAVSAWGAILDPIADKIAVGGAAVGIAALDPSGPYVFPSGLILFRELFVSGLREAGAARGLSFPVTKLAKWKTTAQLVAYGVVILALSGQAWLNIAAVTLIWIAAAITLITGWQYAKAARDGLR